MSSKYFSDNLLKTGIVVSMILWGLSWPSGKVLTNYLSPLSFIVWRYTLVGLTLLPILFIIKSPLSGSRKGIKYIIISGFLLACYSYLFYKGLKYGMAGAGGVLVTTLNPIIAYTIGIFINRRIPSRIELAGLLCGLLAGCILLKIWSQSTIFDSSNLFFLGASFTWALMSVFTSKAKMFGTSFSFSFWQYLFCIFCILPLVNFHEVFSAVYINDSVFWFNMIFSSVIVTALATTLYFYATTKIGPEKASSYIFLVPFAAELSSWLLPDEPLLVHTIAGGILGIVAVYLINRYKVVSK